MNNTTYVRGAIGYTILKSKKNKIMVIADMHDIKEKCGDMFISDWLKRQENFKLLLEEVPPSEVNLKELWSGADHTIKLRELYVNNIEKIVGLDIRGELVKFSWELMKDMYFPPMTLQEYLTYLEQFFNFEHEFFLKDIPEIYNEEILLDKEIRMSIQFEFCFNKYKKFKTKYSKFMEKTVQKIFQTEKEILEEINFMLNMIMEFYTIMQVYKLSLIGVNRFIIHKGLFHTSSIVNWLRELYQFELIETDGLTEFDKVNLIEHTGCLKIPNM
jgi:hypothetical protein